MPVFKAIHKRKNRAHTPATCFQGELPSQLAEAMEKKFQQQITIKNKNCFLREAPNPRSSKYEFKMVFDQAG
jgi:hypothetical protein